MKNLSSHEHFVFCSKTTSKLIKSVQRAKFNVNTLDLKMPVCLTSVCFLEIKTINTQWNFGAFILNINTFYSIIY